MLDGRAVPEGRVDEQVGPALDLSLGERSLSNWLRHQAA